jgi:Zn-finger nucleic acid-binding protein
MDARSEAAMSCPTCRTPLSMSERQGIEIDYCPTCRGVWLDRGELDKIVERSASTPAPAEVRTGAVPPSGRAYGRDEDRHYGDDHRPYGHRKRKKSFLEELFD